MKTSNKLLLTATAIGFIYLVVYNFQLKAEYLKGGYKSQFYGMEFKPLNSFTAIDNRAANIISLHIEKGPKFGVWMNSYIKDKAILSLRNNTLYINYKVKDRMYGYLAGITVVCPSVNNVTTTPITMPDGDWNRATTFISGFNQDTMKICANKSSEIELNKNTLNKLDASTGQSNATLTIHNDNDVKDARINIIGKSELKLFKPITNGSYNYTDSATITLNGKSFRQLQQNH